MGVSELRMFQLRAQTSSRWDENPFVVRLTKSASDGTVADREGLLCDDNGDLIAAAKCRAMFAFHDVGVPGHARSVVLPKVLVYLASGDIVRVIPRTGEVAVLYRRGSRFNSILVTERCNSNCVMCSQPPKAGDDSYLLHAYLEAIPLMARETAELGITGGEPTLLGERLLDLVRACGAHLPRTALHMLSNGRLFNYLSLCQRLAAVGHGDLMIGIPLYSDIGSQHDYVVQAQGAFDQTVRGIMNLARCGLRVEVRVVLHRQTIGRLPQLARFIARNFPFVEHVALMGLEMMGYVRMNLEALWIDPADYQEQLAEAVDELVSGHMNVSIYNHQLCVLSRELWPYARKSISDWKNEYLPVCDGCGAREDCGGFFSSASVRHSDRIRPVAR
jgi:His-Xaa-Ser system radical SAM maturase HxsC